MNDLLPIDSPGERAVDSDESRCAPGPVDGSGLPLPDPYPEYLACPHCGELEVEVFCYQTRARCHRCGEWFDHTPPGCYRQPGCIVPKPDAPEGRD